MPLVVLCFVKIGVVNEILPMFSTFLKQKKEKNLVHITELL
jgi:hypothetical protein